MKDTTDTARSASYIDIHLEIDNERRLRTNIYDKSDDFYFLIVNLNHLYVATFKHLLNMEYIYLSVDPIFQSLWFLSWCP